MTPKGTALINHVWMTRLDDELYSELDDGLDNGTDNGSDDRLDGRGVAEAGPEVLRLGGAEHREDLEGLP